MVDIQELFNRINLKKKQIKDIQQAYKDALKSSGEYQENAEKTKALRERRKQLEAGVKQQFAGEFEQLEAYKIDIASDMVLLSDAAMSLLMKGQQVEVQDEYHNTYDPVFVVKFKKAA